MDTLTNSVCVLTAESEMALSLYTVTRPIGRFRDVIGVPQWSCFGSGTIFDCFSTFNDKGRENIYFINR